MLVFALRRTLWAIPVLLVCVTLLFGVMRAVGGSPLQHGPPLGLSNEAWVKYSDPKPNVLRPASVPLLSMAGPLAGLVVVNLFSDVALAAVDPRLREA